MMVNQLNNNSAPWPSAIPQRMPWISSDQASLLGMQFGQPNDPLVTLSQGQLPTTTALLQTSQHPTTTSYEIASQNQPTITANVPDTFNTCFPTVISNNPFDPCITNHNIVNLNQVQNLPYPLPTNSNSLQQSVPYAQTHYSKSLTHMEFDRASSDQPVPLKRNSIEMEDELIKREEPPTKQQLSESRLFRRFGSLQLDGQSPLNCDDDDDDKDSSSSDDEKTSTSSSSGVSGRKEFSRYVYLLFKEKKSGNSLFNSSSSGTLERLIREEREKLSKAVILWSPPLKNSYTTTQDSDDDEEEFSYSDHRDFLKNPSINATDDSILITEITEEICPDTEVVDENSIVSDDKMIEE